MIYVISFYRLARPRNTVETWRDFYRGIDSIQFPRIKISSIAPRINQRHSCTQRVSLFLRGNHFRRVLFTMPIQSIQLHKNAFVLKVTNLQTG